jgi:two-component system, cell cycle sensor histidine kinase and response regulator CckA
VIVDEDALITYTNARASEILGYGREELVGRGISFLYPSDEQEFDREVAQTLQREPGHYKAQVRRGDGRAVWIDVHTTPFRSGSSDATGAVAAFADITEHHKASAALARAEAHYRRLVQTAPQAIYTVDLEGRITEINAAGEELLGRATEELLGQPFHEILAEEDIEKAQEQFAMLLMGRIDVSDTEFQLRRGSGEVRWARVSSVPIREDGVIVGIHGIAHDTTEQRRTEDQFRQAQKMEAVGRLAGGVAHDFNNLLTAISGYATLLSRELEPGSEPAEFLTEIQRAASRSSDLTRQLLAFSRRQVLSPRVMDLNEVIRAMEKMLRRLIGEHIALHIDVGTEPALVRADPGQMEQVLMNLSVNSRDAMQDGGEIRIHIEHVSIGNGDPLPDEEMPRGQYVCVSVMDTGFGISAEIREHIFEPFFTTKEQGTGLGLSTVYGIVKQSGGFIVVDAPPDRGTTFHIYLPAVDPADGAQSEGDRLEESSGGSEILLLVEDEPSVRNLAHRILRDGGYRILRASNGAEALQLAEAYWGRIDLLVTDVVMPQMSGGTLYQMLREVRPDVRVLFVTGYADETVLRGGVVHSRSHLLKKPFSPEELLSKVREVLDQPQD